MSKEILKDLEGIVKKVRNDGLNPNLTIEDDNGDEHEVELPVKLQNDFDILPYQLACLEQKVKFKETLSIEHGCGLTGYTSRDHEYFLDILSGPLEGQSYHAWRR